MAPFPKSLKELCTPSLVYFVCSIFALVMIFIQNLGNTQHYTIGSFSCRVPNTTVIFIFKFIYVLFWTYILNLICRDGHSTLSWLLVLFPFILLFLIIGIMMVNM
jgi:hypothetical protein